MITNLLTFVVTHTERGECKCGKCIDVGSSTEPQGHTVDMVFFKVAQRGAEPPNAEDFKRLTAEHRGAFRELNPFDGQAHTYIEIGAWIGDQGLSMQYMALGVLLNLFTLFSPLSIDIKGNDALELASLGFLAIQA